MLENVTSYNLSGADDRTAETTVCADARFSETTVCEEVADQQVETAICRCRRQFSGGGCGDDRRRRRFSGGGCRDDRMQAQTTILRRRLRRRQAAGADDDSQAAAAETAVCWAETSVRGEVTVL